MRAAVRKLGNSSGVIIPKSLLDETGIAVGDAVDMTYEQGRIVLIRPTLVREHFAQHCERQLEGLAGGRAEPAHEPLLVERSQLIKQDQPRLAAKPQWYAISPRLTAPQAASDRDFSPCQVLIVGIAELGPHERVVAPSARLFEASTHPARAVRGSGDRPYLAAFFESRRAAALTRLRSAYFFTSRLCRMKPSFFW